jgi:hypothetical protein
MTEAQLVITLTSVLSAVMGALCIVIWTLFRDIQRKLAEIVVVSNEHSTELAVAREQIETNRAKIERHDRLIESEYAEKQAELIVAKLRIMSNL